MKVVMVVITVVSTACGAIGLLAAVFILALGLTSLQIGGGYSGYFNVAVVFAIPLAFIVAPLLGWMRYTDEAPGAGLMIAGTPLGAAAIFVLVFLT